MDAILTQYKTLIFGIFIALGLLIFRKELNKLIDWIVSFKKLTKSKEGYSASTASESPVSRDTEQPPESSKALVTQTETAESDQKERESNWVEPLLAKDYDRACDILRDLIAREDNPQKKQAHRATLGHVIFEQDKKKGIEYFEELLKSSGDSSEIYHWYALSLFWASDHEMAEKVLRRGIEKSADCRELMDLLGLVYHRQGNDIEAVNVLLRAIAKHPRWPKAYQTLAQTLADIDLADEAIQCCQVGMSSCPQDVDLIVKFLNVLPEERASEKRMVAYLRLVNLRPDNATNWALLGNQYLQLELHDLALEAYRKANSIATGKEAWILSNIGNILKNQGFFSHAAEYLQQAVSLDPDYQYAHERLGHTLKSGGDQRAKRDEIKKTTEQDLKVSKSLSGLMERVTEKLSKPVAPGDK